MRQSQAKKSQQKHWGMQWASYWHMNWPGSSWNTWCKDTDQWPVMTIIPGGRAPGWSYQWPDHWGDTGHRPGPGSGGSRWRAGLCSAATPCCSRRARGCRSTKTREVGLQLENELTSLIFFYCFNYTFRRDCREWFSLWCFENLINIHTNWR